MSSGPEFLTGIKDGNMVSREVAVIPVGVAAVVTAVAEVVAAAAEEEVEAAVEEEVEDIADTKPASKWLSASSRKALKKGAGLWWEPGERGYEPRLRRGATDPAS
jgi:hypothetical protein